MHKLNFVSCVAWVRKGVSKESPNRLQLTKEELQLKIEQNKEKLKELNIEDELENEEPVDTDMTEEDKQIADRYNLGDYDNEEVNDAALNHSDLAVFTDNSEDPYLNNEETFSEDEEEREDFQIKPTDNLLLTGHIEEDSISLEVKIYNQHDDVYVHHELYLPAYPLCFEWLDFKNSSHDKVNFLAIGDMNSDINVWDLDTVDILDPDIVLSGHEDSVLSLSWNKILRNIMASGSADQSCRLWDLERKATVQKFDFYKSNVQAVSFHPVEEKILLTGDSNGKASVIDCKSNSIKKWKVCSDEIEKVVWNPYNPYTYLCGTSTGFVYNIDCRNENSQLYTIKAHIDMISGLEFSSSCNGCLLTTSSDKFVKIWDIDEKEGKFIKDIDPKVGTILSLSANPDYPFVFAVSGDYSSDNNKVIDISTIKAVHDHFQNRI